ncbi:hypothetical protein D3C85_693490 [compost metagenome]
MKQGISKDSLLSKAKNGFFVSRYSWSHEKLRKKARRMCKDGLIYVEFQNKDGWFYKLRLQPLSHGSDQ